MCATRPTAGLSVRNTHPFEQAGHKAIGPGELLHVDPELHVTARRVLHGPPSRPLTLDDLGARAASQAG